MNFCKKIIVLFAFGVISTCNVSASQNTDINEIIDTKSELSTLNIDELIKEKSNNKFSNCIVNNNGHGRNSEFPNKNYKSKKINITFFGDSIGGFENWADVKDFGKEFFQNLFIAFKAFHSCDISDHINISDELSCCDIYPID